MSVSGEDSFVETYWEVKDLVSDEEVFVKKNRDSSWGHHVEGENLLTDIETLYDAGDLLDVEVEYSEDVEYVDGGAEADFRIRMDYLDGNNEESVFYFDSV